MQTRWRQDPILRFGFKVGYTPLGNVEGYAIIVTIFATNTRFTMTI